MVQVQSQDPNIKVSIAEQARKQYEEQKQRMMPLVKFLKKNGLKFKHAGCQGGKVEYFRMDSLQQILDNKKEELANHPKLSVLAQTVKDNLYYFKRPENSQKLRYPQVLVPIRGDTGKFACFRFDTTQSKRIYFIMVLFAILTGVLFPLWPYSLKYSLWILSVVLLVVLVSVILLRLVLYVIMASFGVSFWLLPNLFGDYGLMDSLRPVYSLTRWENDVFSIILRVLSFGLFIYYCHSIYIEPEFYMENFQSAKDIVKDVHDWGVDKIKGEAGNFSQRALTMDKIINETADAFDAGSKDHYTSFEAPVEDVPEETETEEKQDAFEDKQNAQDLEAGDEREGEDLQENEQQVEA